MFMINSIASAEKSLVIQRHGNTNKCVNTNLQLIDYATTY
jgi:hypothetical protein